MTGCAGPAPINPNYLFLLLLLLINRVVAQLSHGKRPKLPRRVPAAQLLRKPYLVAQHPPRPRRPNFKNLGPPGTAPKNISFLSIHAYLTRPRRNWPAWATWAKTDYFNLNGLINFSSAQKRTYSFIHTIGKTLSTATDSSISFPAIELKLYFPEV